MLLFPFSEEMCEVLVIKFGESLPVVDGFAHDKHGGEGELVVVNYLCEVFQLAAINLLVGPGEVVAGCDGRVLGIFLQQFSLHVIHNSGREEDAHRALAASQQVELLLLGHWRTSFATGKDDSLCAFGNGELTF